jgi:hydrogenase maturation protease
MKTLVLGLGNPILTDDGVGIQVVKEAAIRCQACDVTFAQASLGGLRLLDALTGYDRVILVDAILTVDGKPGDIYRLGPGDVQASLHSDSTHDMSLPCALALGRKLGIKLPEDDAFTIIAVEAQDVLNFGETPTLAVAAALPAAVEMVLDTVASSMH